MNKIALTLIFGIATSASAIEKRKFDFVVGVDGDMKAAFAKASGSSESKHFLLFVPDGTYDITQLTGDENGRSFFNGSHVSIIGQSQNNTIILNTNSGVEGISTTATIYFPKNNDIYMQDITLQNRSNFNSGSAERHVALQQNSGDKFIFKNVRLLSTQDTYYTKSGRTYWEDGEIDGTVDFICGGGDVFFEGTKLVVGRSGGYITASQNPGTWGYVFNNATITVSDDCFNGTFYLGRSWGAAKVVYMNTKMIAQPTAAGWGSNMNSAPVVFGEYNSKDGNGNAVNTSQRRTYFDGSKDNSTAKLNTVWSTSDAAKYTIVNVMGGTDNWQPNKSTAQVSSPKISQEGAEITWTDDEDALCYFIFVNGKYKANVTTNSFNLNGIAEGSKITVRAANSMGGLGASSNEITTVEANVKYYNITLEQGIGGSISISTNSNKVAEGKTFTIAATPLEGWSFAGWSGRDASFAGDKATYTATANCDISLSAMFIAKGISTFQTETGIIENAINESTNAGFKGTGYVNFSTGNSSVKVPVYVDSPGTYNMTMRYANGSSTDRDLNIVTAGGTTEQLNFIKTGAWTIFENKESTVKLPAGASFITFTVVGENDGPNLDQITLTPIDTDVPQDTTDSTNILDTIFPASDLQQNFTRNDIKADLFSIQGKFIRTLQNVHPEKMTKEALQIPAGNYIVRMQTSGFHKQVIVQVR